MAYRMSYVCRPGPPKPRGDLAPDEGLTDRLLVVSILGIPGGPGPLSVMPVQLGPDGVETLDIATSVAIASVMLAVVEDQHPAARAGIAAIRKVILAGRAL